MPLTVVPTQPPVHWVRPVKTNQVLSLPRQSGKPKFPLRKKDPTWNNKPTPQVQQPCQDLTCVFISLAMMFMKSLSPSFLQKKSVSPLCSHGSSFDFPRMVSYLCRLKKLPLSGLLLKFWAMRTAMSLSRLTLVCKTCLWWRWASLLHLARSKTRPFAPEQREPMMVAM